MSEKLSIDESNLPMIGRNRGRSRIRPIERAKDRKGTLNRVWRYLKNETFWLVVTAVIVALSVILNLAGPYLIGVAIDQTIRKHDIPKLIKVCSTLLAIYGANSIVYYFENFIMAGVAQRTIRDIRNDAFSKLQTLSIQYFDRHSDGDIMSRLINDIENINSVLSDSVIQIVFGVLSTTGIAITMLSINPMLAGCSISTIIILSITLNRWVGRNTRAGFQEQQKSLGLLNGYIEETINGQRVVKTYGREKAAVESFRTYNSSLQKSAIKAQVYAGFVGPVMDLIGSLALTIVAAFGGILAIHNLISIGMIASFITYTRQFNRPFSMIANLYNSIQSAIAGAERIFEIIDEPEEKTNETISLEQSIDGNVVFNGVSFSYRKDVPVLKDIEIDVKSGQVIALIGPTGAGKTTVINLLTRFYEVDHGTISVGGIDIAKIYKSDLRRQLGIVLQDTVLFSGSIIENIRYGRLEATDEEVFEAAKLANVDRFIQRLPHGYNSLITDRGANLSHGQRQLIAIARAVLADPKILILDEATSSVDTRTERHIQEAMQRLMIGRTSFVIAHRLSTIRQADQILVIDHGEVVERGNHDELLALHGVYYSLYMNNRPKGVSVVDEFSDQRDLELVN
jgi:ATP-binding cassette subfamily B protein